MMCSEIWSRCFLDDYQPTYFTNLRKKTIAWYMERQLSNMFCKTMNNIRNKRNKGKCFCTQPCHKITHVSNTHS